MIPELLENSCSEESLLYTTPGPLRVTLPGEAGVEVWFLHFSPKGKFRGFARDGGFPEKFWLYRNLIEHLKIIWKNILSYKGKVRIWSEYRVWNMSNSRNLSFIVNTKWTYFDFVTR